MDRQNSLWDQLLPTQARILGAELTAVDECLADGEVEHHAVLVLAHPPGPPLQFTSATDTGLGAATIAVDDHSRQGLLTLRTQK